MQICGCSKNLRNTLVKKRNPSPFHLQILKVPDGVQASNGVRWNAQLPNDKSLLHCPKKVTPQFFKIQVEQARSFFFEGVYLRRYCTNYLIAVTFQTRRTKCTAKIVVQVW